MNEMTYSEWYQEGVRRFGEDVMRWAFVCPSCGQVVTVQEYANAKAPEGGVGFNCIGRYLAKCNDAFSNKAPCNYTSGGLICISPVRLVDRKNTPVFAFADVEAKP